MPTRLRVSCRLLVSLGILSVAGVAPAAAQWTVTGDPVCTETHDQNPVSAVPTPDGGVIIVWQDGRGSVSDIYAQKLDSTGVAQWTTNGIPVCTAAGGQYGPQAIPDQGGGAIVAWIDNRNPSSDLYAQRINASGVALWAPDGVPICTADDSQSLVKIIPDGLFAIAITDHPGAIVLWNDSRNAISSGVDLYMQRIDGTGALTWPGGTSGVRLSEAPGNQEDADLCGDGTGGLHISGGAFVAWIDSRTGFRNVYAKRINSVGVRQWASDGITVCSAAGNQTLLHMCYAAGKAFIAWGDNRTPTSHIFAQTLDVNGTPQWTPNGVPVCEEAGGQSIPIMVTIGGGETIVGWDDQRNGANNQDLYAQRLSAAGTRLWPTAGVPISTAPGHQNGAAVVGDGAGGAVFCWLDGRNGPGVQVYAQRVDINGNVRWQTDGVRVCSVIGAAFDIAVVYDLSMGAIAAWSDHRAGNYDVYANRITGNGTVDAPPVATASFGFTMLSSNPDRGAMRFALQVPRVSSARVEVVDLSGRRVRLLLEESAHSAGSQTLSWDGRDDSGARARAGIYFVTARAGTESRVIKVVELD